tara:strand:- start:142 stop:318 length:177 start_codon:yes stop_codon:yes gene_type:complete
MYIQHKQQMNFLKNFLLTLVIYCSVGGVFVYALSDALAKDTQARCSHPTLGVPEKYCK